MILNCPSCSAKFMVSAAAFGSKGRDVRCGKCGHTWFQDAPHDSLDDLQKLVDKMDAAPVGADMARESAHGDAGSSSLSAVAGGDVVGDVARPEIKLDKSPRDYLKPQGTVKKQSFVAGVKSFYDSHQKIIAGFAAALAMVSVLVWIILLIARPIYAPKDSQLMLDQIQTKMESGALVGSFRVTNLSAEDQVFPTFKVVLTDAQGRIITRTTVPPVMQHIKHESTEPVEFRFEKVPSVVAHVKILSE